MVNTICKEDTIWNSVKDKFSKELENNRENFFDNNSGKFLL